MKSDEFNLFVFKGESQKRKVFCILPKITWNSLFQFIYNKKLKSKLLKKLESDAEYIRINTRFREISIFDLFPEFFKTIYEDWFFQLICHAKTIEKAMIEKKINLLITHSDHSILERISLFISHKLNIPTIYAQHGVDGQPPNIRLGFPSEAKNLFVWGPVNKKMLIANGENPNKIKVVGCPLYPFINYNKPIKPLDVNQPGTWLFIGYLGRQFRCDNRMSMLDTENHMRIALNAIKAFPKKTLLIKPRYDDSQIQIFQKMIKELKIDNALIQAGPIENLIRECDLFFNVYSTAGLEAIMLNKAGIQLTFSYDNKSPFIKRSGTKSIPSTEYGATLGLNQPSSKKLIEIIKNIYMSPEINEKLRIGRIHYLKDFANLGHGDPAENFLIGIKEVLKIN